ncbi:MAG: major capsid protein [Alphaproteobacteria bacterium]|nr:major capsid protein [Alphaproteobacteria bacterium]
MSDRLSAVRVVDPVLSNLALGYTNAEYVGNKLFPIVNIDKEAGKIPKFNKETFMVYQTNRAVGADSNMTKVDALSTIDVVLDENEIGSPIDYREQSDAIFNLEKRATYKATEAIALGREVIQAKLATDQGNYSANNKITLAGATQWTGASGDPIATIETAKEAIRSAIGQRPNTLVISAAVFKVLKNHKTLLDRVKYTTTKVLTTDLLSEVFDIANIYRADAVYADDAGNFGDIWGSNVVVAYVKQTQQGIEGDCHDPSFGYTVRRRGMPIVDSYNREGNKVRVVRCTDISKSLIVDADAGYLIQGAI